MTPNLGPTHSTSPAACFGVLIYLIRAIDAKLWQKDRRLYKCNRSRLYGYRDHCSSVSRVLAVCVELPLRQELLSSRVKFEGCVMQVLVTLEYGKSSFQADAPPPIKKSKIL